MNFLLNQKKQTNTNQMSETNNTMGNKQYSTSQPIISTAAEEAEKRISMLQTLYALYLDQTEAIKRKSSEVLSLIAENYTQLPKQLYDIKWKQIKLRLESILSGFPTRIQLEDCKIILRKTMLPDGTLYSWSLLGPVEFLGGKHRIEYSLNAFNIMPTCCGENELLIDYLAQENKIEIILNQQTPPDVYMTMVV